MFYRCDCWNAWELYILCNIMIPIIPFMHEIWDDISLLGHVGVWLNVGFGANIFLPDQTGLSQHFLCMLPMFYGCDCWTRMGIVHDYATPWYLFIPFMHDIWDDISFLGHVGVVVKRGVWRHTWFLLLVVATVVHRTQGSIREQWCIDSKLCQAPFHCHGFMVKSHMYKLFWIGMPSIYAVESWDDRYVLSLLGLNQVFVSPARSPYLCLSLSLYTFSDLHRRI